MATCICMGPQHGAPLCPCMMRAAGVWGESHTSRQRVPMTPTNGRPEPVGHGLAEEGRIKIGQPMPYVCPACQAIPTAGHCSMDGCPTAPAKATSPPSSVDVAEGRRLRNASRNKALDGPEGFAWRGWLNANFDALLDSAERAATLQSSHDLALAEAERLREENERLRLLILGGEDVPGVAASLTIEQVEEVHRDNQLFHHADRDRAMAALREAGEGLEPFAKAGHAVPDHFSDDTPAMRFRPDRVSFHVTCGNFRRAAAIHAKIKELIDAEG